MNEIELIRTLPDVLQSQIRDYTPHPLAVVYLNDIIRNGWYFYSEKYHCQINKINTTLPGVSIDQILWFDEDELWEDYKGFTQFEYEFWINNKSFCRKHMQYLNK